MTVTVDTSTEDVRTGTTSPQTFSHAGAASGVRGVVVAIVHGTSSTDHVTACSYGGVALRRYQRNTDTANEPGASELWFLGVGVPQGTQTVSYTPGATTDDIHCVCITLLADRELEVIDNDGISENVANPSVTLQYQGRSAMAFAALYGGGADPTAFTQNANCTTVQDHDLGAFYSEIIRQTTAGTADFAIGGTSATDDVAFSAIAVSEIQDRDIAQRFTQEQEVDQRTRNGFTAAIFAAAALLIPPPAPPADTIQRGALVTQEQKYEPSTASYGRRWFSAQSIPNANSIGNAEYTSGTQQYAIYNEGRAVWFKVPNEIVAVAAVDEPALRTLVSVADQSYDPAYAKTWFAHELIPDADEIAGSEIHTGSQHLDYAEEAYAKTFRVPVEILATVDGVPHTLTAAPQTLDAAYGKTFQYPPEPLVVVDQGVPKTLYAAQEPGDLQTRAYTWFADALIPDANSIGSAQFTSGAHAADYAAQSKGTVWSTPASLYGAEVVTDIYRATYVVQPQAINQAQGVVFHAPTELAAVVDGVPGTLFASELRADAGYAQLFDVPPEIAAVVGGIPGTIVQDEIRADSGYASVFEVPAEIAVVVPGIPHTLVQGEVRADAGYAKTFRYQPESVEFVVAPKTLYAAPEPADTQTRAYVWFADPEIPDADAIGAKRYTFGTHAADYAAQCRAEVWGTPAPLNVVAEAIYRTTFVQGEVRADAGYAGELFTVPTEILAVVPGIPHTLVTPEVRADNGYATTFDVPVEIAAVIPGIPGTLVQGEVRADSGYAALFDVPLGIAVSAEPPPPHTLYAYPQTQLIDPAYGKIFSYSWAISAFALPPKTLVAVPPVDTGSAQTFQYAWELHAVALPPKTLYAYPQTQLVDPAYGLVWHLGQLPGIDLPPPPTRIVWPQTHYVDPAYALLWQYPWESERFALPPKTLYAYPQNQFIDPAYFERTGGKPQPEPIPLGLKLPHKFIVVEMDNRYVTVELDPRESVVIQIKRYVDVGD